MLGYNPSIFSVLHIGVEYATVSRDDSSLSLRSISLFLRVVILVQIYFVRVTCSWRRGACICGWCVANKAIASVLIRKLLMTNCW